MPISALSSDSTSTVKPVILNNNLAKSDSTKTDSTYVMPLVYPDGTFNQKPAKGKKEANTWGITPLITEDQNRNGGTVGANVDLWRLMSKDDKGTFDFGVENRMGKDLSTNKNMLSKDLNVYAYIDPGVCKIGTFNRNLKFLGELQIRPTVDLNYGYNSEFKTNRLDGFGSFAMGLNKPFQSDKFKLVNYFGFTVAYSGSAALSGKKMDVLLGNYEDNGEAADRELSVKTEIRFAPKPGSSIFDFADIYMKNNLGRDPFNPYLTSREKFRLGGYLQRRQEQVYP